jgi:hypothetical protein
MLESLVIQGADRMRGATMRILPDLLVIARYVSDKAKL